MLGWCASACGASASATRISARTTRGCEAPRSDEPGRADDRLRAPLRDLQARRRCCSARSRLAREIVGEDRPVVFVFAGKAHPADEPGQAPDARDCSEMAQQPEFLGKVLLVEGYDMGLARCWTSGVDVWLNNPVIRSRRAAPRA
jgi:hypothetical protein